MQDMPALSDNGENTNLTANQITYMKKRMFRLADMLSEHVHTMHPALSVGFRVNPTPMTFDMDISLSTPRLPRQHLATINGFIDLKWAHNNGHGKEMSICAAIATGESRGQQDRFDMMALNHRREIRAVSNKITEVLTDLQALPDMSNQNTYSAWLLLKQLDFQPWKVKKTLREHFESQTRLTPDTPSDEMTPRIVRALQRVESNFRRRYVKRNNIFDNVAFNYNGINFNFNATFTLNSEHAADDRTVKIKAPVTVGWKGGTHCYYIQIDGGPRIDITQTDSSTDIMQIMLESGTIRDADTLFDRFQNGAKNEKTERIQKRVRSYIPKKAGKTFNELANDNEQKTKDIEKFDRKSSFHRHARRTGKQELRRQIS